MASSSGKTESPVVTGDTPRPEVTARRERRIGEIVLAAAARDTEQREAFLRQVTVADPDLLEEARRRLRLAAELPRAFLAVPAAEILEAADLAAEPEPATLGVAPMVDGAARYELGECLGQGGMARVYRAFDRQLERPVALKLLERADPKTLRRFQREAQVQAKVRHEYVLEVYETGELGGQPFIAMYYVDGPTLMDVRDDTTLEQKVRLSAQVAEGLHAAHRVGLIHRDVKPSNILVEATADGRLKPRVADFGIATSLGGGSSMWSATLAGTPYYIAPERLVDDDQQVDRRSDVYSLGVTIYQLLTGEQPFHHPRLTEMLRQVREEPPTSMREHDPSLPAELDAVVMKCLAKDPDARYPTARAVADDLWRFLDGEPVEAHTTTFTYRLARTATHGRSLPTAALIAGAALIAVLAAIVIRTSVEERRLAGEAETALEDLAIVYHDLGRCSMAEPLYRRALELRRQRLGAEHPRAVDLAERLASCGEPSDRSAAVEPRTPGEPP